MIDFIATWFDPYSKFLAGQNRAVASFLDGAVLKMYFMLRYLIELLVDAWLLCEVIKYANDSDLSVESM